MTTHPVYDQLLSEVTDDLERQVLQVLIERAGMSVGAVCEMQREIANLESMLKYAGGSK
jgi:hypothetical protein